MIHRPRYRGSKQVRVTTFFALQAEGRHDKAYLRAGEGLLKSMQQDVNKRGLVLS